MPSSRIARGVSRGTPPQPSGSRPAPPSRMFQCNKCTRRAGDGVRVPPAPACASEAWRGAAMAAVEFESKVPRASATTTTTRGAEPGLASSTTAASGCASVSPRSPGGSSSGRVTDCAAVSPRMEFRTAGIHPIHPSCMPTRTSATGKVIATTKSTLALRMDRCRGC
ncbi:hypothetical protein T492DRAFT_88689 [Pavlovales sp. CCMP2436]|nr:hypothetical protein T492DRAFT_88689 [Pavlovales sp. CCMP2436]